MRVTIRFFDGCPHWKIAEERLREAVVAAGVEDRATVVLERIATAEEAEGVRFRGSPTILIDGQDPFAAEEGGFGLTCRVYRTERGLEGSPSVDMLRGALSGAS